MGVEDVVAQAIEGSSRLVDYERSAKAGYRIRAGFEGHIL